MRYVAPLWHTPLGMTGLRDPGSCLVGGYRLHAEAPRAAVAREVLPGGAVGAGVRRRAARSRKAGQVHHPGRRLPLSGWTVHVVHLQNTQPISCQLSDDPDAKGRRTVPTVSHLKHLSSQ